MVQFLSHNEQVKKYEFGCSIPKPFVFNNRLVTYILVTCAYTEFGEVRQAVKEGERKNYFFTKSQITFRRLKDDGTVDKRRSEDSDHCDIMGLALLNIAHSECYASAGVMHQLREALRNTAIRCHASLWKFNNPDEAPADVLEAAEKKYRRKDKYGDSFAACQLSTVNLLDPFAYAERYKQNT